MPKPASVFLDGSAREVVVSRFFATTSPHFDAAMGKRLAEIRKSMGITQRELAERLGLSQVHISRLEKGKNLVAMPKCSAFKIALGNRFEKLLKEDGLVQESELDIEYNKQIRKMVGSKRNNIRVG